MAKQSDAPKEIRGAARVITKAGPVWCHYSQRGETVKLRRYVDGAVVELEGDNDDIDDIVPLSKCKTLHKDADNYKYANINVWTKILNKLNANKGILGNQSQRKETDKPTIVPITQLRLLYELMKLLDKATWEGLSRFYNEYPDSLERLWNHSHKIFEAYNNNDKWGQGSRKDLPDAPESVTAIKSTNDCNAFIVKHQLSLNNGERQFSYVERELNPRSTKGGLFSDKAPATKSGRGGIDVLLKSSPAGLPVVGEIKVGSDKNAFFALIQAMTYAVELTTKNQLTRLKRHLSDFSQLDLENARVGVALLMVNPVEDSSLEPVLELVGHLNERNQCIGLGEIVVARTDGENWNLL